MAVLHKKEEKIEAVLAKLPKKYTDEQFVEAFIKLYSRDWGKIKSAYVKQSQDREPGAIVNMPKPEVYLKQVLAIYLQNKPAAPVKEEKEDVVEAPATPVKKAKATAKKKEETVEKPSAPEKKTKPVAKKPATKK